MARSKTLLLKNPHADKNFSDEDLNRIVEMGWEDRTAFEAIEQQFGINQDGVIKIMRANLKRNSFELWRKRTRGQITKHLKLRSPNISRHQSKQHNKVYR
jgi:uncharacterized protein (TIGR03643 family)